MYDKERQAQDDAQDLRWVKSVRSGSIRAFDRLVKKYQKRLYIVIRKMVIAHEDTDDIVQEAFVKAFRNLDRFDPSYAFYPWLHRIVVNTAVNHQKKKSRQMERTRIDDIVEPAASVNGSDPAEQVLKNELKEKISEALDKLPSEQRMVFILRTAEDLSYEEISETLDISTGTVMSRLSRAREKLKILLKPYLNGGKD